MTNIRYAHHLLCPPPHSSKCFTLHLPLFKKIRFCYLFIFAGQVHFFIEFLVLSSPPPHKLGACIVHASNRAQDKTGHKDKASQDDGAARTWDGLSVDNRDNTMDHPEVKTAVNALAQCKTETKFRRRMPETADVWPPIPFHICKWGRSSRCTGGEVVGLDWRPPENPWDHQGSQGTSRDHLPWKEDVQTTLPSIDLPCPLLALNYCLAHQIFLLSRKPS